MRSRSAARLSARQRISRWAASSVSLAFNMSRIVIDDGGECEQKTRCPWARSEPMIAYHDREWGVPIHDDRKLFEAIVLDGAQAGLSWQTILLKRDNYRAAFDGFD